jgi:hypothetical protein
MSRKAFPLRINADILAAMQRWADDDLRSVNAQIEYVLRDTLVTHGRVKLVQKVTTEVVDANAPKTSKADFKPNKVSFANLTFLIQLGSAILAHNK